MLMAEIFQLRTTVSTWNFRIFVTLLVTHRNALSADCASSFIWFDQKMWWCDKAHEANKSLESISEDLPRWFQILLAAALVAAWKLFMRSQQVIGKSHRQIRWKKVEHKVYKGCSRQQRMWTEYSIKLSPYAWVSYGYKIPLLLICKAAFSRLSFELYDDLKDVSYIWVLQFSRSLSPLRLLAISPPSAPLI